METDKGSIGKVNAFISRGYILYNAKLADEADDTKTLEYRGRCPLKVLEDKKVNPERFVLWLNNQYLTGENILEWRFANGKIEVNLPDYELLLTLSLYERRYLKTRKSYTKPKNQSNNYCPSCGFALN